MLKVALLVVVGACVVSQAWLQGLRGSSFASSSFNTPGSSLLSGWNFQDFSTRPWFPPIAKNCSDAKASCVKRCGSEYTMNFQCDDTNGLQSSCACTSPSGGSSTTARCLAAKAACEAKCPGKVAFRCSDSGNSFSKSCSCVHGDEDTAEDQDSVVTSEKEQQDSHLNGLTNVKTFTKEEDEQPLIVQPVKISTVSQVVDNDVEDEEEEKQTSNLFSSWFSDEDEDEDTNPFSSWFADEDEEEEEDTNPFSSLFNNFPSIKMDPFSNWNSNLLSSRSFSNSGNFGQGLGSSSSSRAFASSGGSFNTFGQGIGTFGNQQMDETCENARKKCEIQCTGLKMDFDCKNEGGSYAKSCSCAGHSGNSASSSSSSSSSGVFDNIM